MTLLPRQPTPHGFVAYGRCARCGTERPETALRRDDVAGLTPLGSRCTDVAWCDRQAGRATGLDANGDAE